jgi:hypothetical protein
MKPTGSGRLQSESGPKTLEELAGRIHRCFLQLEDAGTSDWIQAEAARAFDLYYPQYLDLGGRPFRPVKDWLLDLTTLEERCRGEVLSKPQDSPVRPANGKWSQPMNKGNIKAALGLDSYYLLDKLSKEGVYRIRQDPNNRQHWMIRLDTLDSETRQKLRTT